MAGGPLVNPPGTGRHGGPGMITERGSGPYNVMITTLAAPACQRLPSRGMAEVRRVATSSGLVSLFTLAGTGPAAVRARENCRVTELPGVITRYAATPSRRCC